MSEKRKTWEPPTPKPGQMFMFVRVGGEHVGGATEGSLSVSLDASLADLRKALLDLVQSPAFLEKAHCARTTAIWVLSNEDEPFLHGEEEVVDSALLKDLGFDLASTSFAAEANATLLQIKPLSLRQYAPTPTPEGLAEAAAAEDLPPSVQTDDTKCVGGCGFFGRQSGHCSSCWASAPAELKRFYTHAFGKLRAKRESVLARLEQAEAKVKAEKQARWAAEQEKRKEAEARAEEIRKANEERKAAGKCYRCSQTVGDGWYIWSREDCADGSCPHTFAEWTCGLRTEEHHEEGPCDPDMWQGMHTLISELKDKVLAAEEQSEATERWEVFWVSRQQQEAAGAATGGGVGGDSVADRLRKVLRLPDSVPWAECTPVAWSKLSFWDKENHKGQKSRVDKLKAATKAIKGACDQGSVVKLSFNPDHQGPCYPVMLVGMAKETGHLIVAHAKVVWT